MPGYRPNHLWLRLDVHSVSPVAASSMEARATILEDRRTMSSRSVIGCEHYRRKCALLAQCCGRIFTCRLCHDQESDHTMNRHEVQILQCLVCGLQQQVSIIKLMRVWWTKVWKWKVQKIRWDSYFSNQLFCQLWIRTSLQGVFDDFPNLG